MKYDPPRMDSLKEALKIYYFALTVSNKMRKDNLATCLESIKKIYKNFEGGEKSSHRLDGLFSTHIASKDKSKGNHKISFLVDISGSMNVRNRIDQAADTLI